ncbi:MAG: hypothetical protein K0S11_710 [Gammaproteobacteria bacterium]|jgi:hypothetical protein|nr:hypothetical protein [Gammaproteobacteria bacterium]
MPLSQSSLFTPNDSRQEMLHEQLGNKLEKSKNVDNETYLKKLAPLLQSIREAGGMPKLRKLEFDGYIDGDIEPCLWSILLNQTLDDELALTLFEQLCDECNAVPWGMNRGYGSLLVLALRWDRPQIAAYLIEKAQGKAGLTFLEYRTSDGISALALACEEKGWYQGIDLKLNNSTNNPTIARLLQNKIQQLKQQLQAQVEEEPSIDENAYTEENQTGLRQRGSRSIGTSAYQQPKHTSNANLSLLIDSFNNWLFSKSTTKQHQGKGYRTLPQHEQTTPKKEL